MNADIADFRRSQDGSVQPSVSIHSPMASEIASLRIRKIRLIGVHPRSITLDD